MLLRIAPNAVSETVSQNIVIGAGPLPGVSPDRQSDPCSLSKGAGATNRRSASVADLLVRQRARNRGWASAIEAYMDQQERPVLSATDARQAVRGHGVRYVLAISVSLAVVAMIVAYFVA